MDQLQPQAKIIIFIQKPNLRHGGVKVGFLNEMKSLNRDLVSKVRNEKSKQALFRLFISPSRRPRLTIRLIFRGTSTPPKNKSKQGLFRLFTSGKNQLDFFLGGVEVPLRKV